MTNDARTVRRAVTERYGSLARRAAAGSAGAPDDAISLTTAGPSAGACCDDSCCAPAAPQQSGLTLEPADRSADACCDDSCCLPADGAQGMPYVQQLYESRETAGLPESVLGAVAGCGNPGAMAELQPGETVLDLGSGGGIDCFLAAKQVGPSGRVIGVDMTPDMISLARDNAAKLDASNVVFKLSEIEDLPLSGGSVDVIISNCVINLSTDKGLVFREAFRVLRPGGRLRVSDMVWLQARPEPSSSDGWAACVDGALALEDYLSLIREAGFLNVRAEPRVITEGKALASALVFAEKPALE